MDGNSRDFTKGLKLHQAGDLKRAEQVYRRVLRSDPWHADAMHLLGVIFHQRGEHERALDYINQAIALQPGNPLFHNNQGAALQGLGRLDDAVESYQQAVQLDPDSAQAQFTLGLTLLCQQNGLGAQARFQQAIRLRPQFAEAHFNLGIAYQSQERWAEAAECYTQAARIKKDYAEAFQNLGIACSRLGRHAEAIAAFETVLKLRPDAAETCLHIGTACQMLGRTDEAAACYRKYLNLRPGSPEVFNNLGILAQSERRLAQARDFYTQALALQPDYFEARYNLATLDELLGDQVQAEEGFRAAVLLRPGSVEAHNNLGNLLSRQGRLEAAASCYEAALSHVPEYAEGCLNLGNVRSAQNRHLEAVAAYMQALELRPDYVEALNNLGTTLIALGKPDQARESFRLALQICPGFVQAHNNLGNLFNSLGLYEEATACYRAAMQAAPDQANAYNNLGAVLNAQGKLDDAERSFRRAIELNPDYCDAHANLARVLQVQGKPSEAEEAYYRALQLKPSCDMGIAWATMLPPVYESHADLLEWRTGFAANLERLAQDEIALDPAHDLIPVNFYLAYQGFNDCELQQQVARLHRAQPGHEAPPALPAAAHPQTDHRLRVGFISRHFKSHTIGHFMQGLIARLSRNDFHVTVLSVGTHSDETADFIQRHADEYVVLPEQIPLARDLVAARQLDLLCYADVGMEPVTYTLAFSRLAPVQCVTWGHPVTTGIGNMDYFLSSDLIEPADAAAHYSETLVRLPTLPTYYYRPAPPAVPRGRAAFGLPDDGAVYLCPQSLFKFHPDFDPVLAKILRRDPTGCLAIIEPPHAHWKTLLLQRLHRTVGDACDRIIWVPRQDQDAFLELLGVASVLLDPLHFGGGNTTYQALAMGTPIVTLPSGFMRGRVTLGCYQKMGHAACVAGTAEEYVDLAVRLGTDAGYREQIHQEILAASSVLFEDQSAVDELSAFFKAAVQLQRNQTGRAA